MGGGGGEAVHEEYMKTEKEKYLKGNGYAFMGVGRGQLCQNLFHLPSEKGSTLTENIKSLVYPLIERILVLPTANWKSQKLSSL